MDGSLDERWTSCARAVDSLWSERRFRGVVGRAMVVAMRTASIVLVGLGALFLALAVVYGYVFNVWSDLASFLAGRADHAPTKTGEAILFALLAIGLPLLACPLGVLSRGADR